MPVGGVAGDSTMSNSLSLRYMGDADIPECPKDSDISILFHPKEYLLTCAKQSEYITVITILFSYAYFNRYIYFCD